MGFNCGIVGLPNVGKSTLFNALTQTAKAQAANYPFCTIEPNSGRVNVPDPRLDQVSKIAQSLQVIPTQLEFVDIAGLVKGASKGEGLGNQFLGHIRSVDAIIHVLRCFEDDNITHVDGFIDPLRDLTTIETELMLADLQNLENRLENLRKKIKAGDKEAKQLSELCEKIIPYLHEGKPARGISLTEPEKPFFQQLQLLTSKPILYVCNVSEEEAATGNAFTKTVAEYGKEHAIPVVTISAAIEAELAVLTSEDQQDYLESLGLKETGLSQIVQTGYGLLELITYFTVGPKEARAWTITHHTKAPQAAGVIHSDFEKGFICAEVIGYQDYIDCQGEAGAKVQGKWRQEGRDYVVQDGDIIHFRFNV